MNELDFIGYILKEASAYIRAKYAGRTRIQVREKNGVNDLLTDVDLAVQKQIVDRISSAFPADSILAEEAGLDQNPGAAPARCWIIDPIDGTQNFVRGLFPAFGITIAFAREGQIACAGVSLPITQDLFLAERGAGAFRNAQSIRVSQHEDLSRARMLVDFSIPQHREPTLAAFGGILRKAGSVRCNGSAVVDLCSVACGEADAYVHVGLNPWDYAAGQLLVEEAGGRATRLDGSPLNVFDGGHGLIASNGYLHELALSQIFQSETHSHTTG